MAANTVDVLIVSASRDGPPALATEILRHPVLAALSDRTRVVVMPGRLWNCGGPAVVEAIERLMQIATEVRAEARPNDGRFGRRSVRLARVPPYGVLVAGLAILVVILMGASLAIGYAPLDLVQAFRDVFKGEKTLATLVLTELRLPRALLGCFVGLSLGISGAAMQGCA